MWRKRPVWGALFGSPEAPEKLEAHIKVDGVELPFPRITVNDQG